jgi:hypothetical protein
LSEQRSYSDFDLLIESSGGGGLRPGFEFTGRAWGTLTLET